MPVVCKARTYSALPASQTYPENPAGWDKGTPSPAELVQPVLGRHVLTQRTQSSFSFLFPRHPTSMSPSLARAGIQEQIQNSPTTGLLLLCLPSSSSTQWQGIKSLRTSAGGCTWVTTETKRLPASSGSHVLQMGGWGAKPLQSHFLDP